jgi:STE24 endopeptidase
MVCYLKYRQREAIIKAQAPPEIFADHYTGDEFAAARTYEFDKINFGIICTLINGLKMIVFSLIIGFLWKHTGRKMNKYIHSIIFTIVVVILYIGSNVPTDYYSTFVIEEKHGFNKTTLELFITDRIKKLIIGIIACFIIVPVLVLINDKAGSKFIIYTVSAYFIFVIALQLLFPVVIYPLFTKLTPLTEGPVFDSVMKLSNKTGFPLKEIYIADDSKRSSHQNAMVFGLFTKKIAVADTLLNKTTPEDITAIVGHEIGHSRHHHIPKMLVLDLITSVFTFSMLFFILKSENIFKDFGIVDEKGKTEINIIVGFIILSLITSPIDEMLQLPINMCMRHFEYQADAFSASLKLPIDISLIKLAHDNFMAVEPDSLYSAFTHTHPTIPQRVKAIREILAKFD